MKYVIIGLLSIGLLSGCATPASNRVTVPSVVEYDAATQKRAADEMASGACSVLNEFIVDYGVMRDEARVALGRKVDLKR